MLAKMCFYVFTPALTLGKLAQAISVESVKQLWPLLANMTIRQGRPSITVGCGDVYSVHRGRLVQLRCD